MSKKIRIANGQGFWGDSIQAPIDLIKKGNIDYLTLDYLAEVTLSIMQRQKNISSDRGYAYDFVDLIKNTISDIMRNKIKIITNAGGVNPYECSKMIKKIAIANNFENIKIGIVKGDDILTEMKDLVKGGLRLDNMDTNNNINDIIDNICSANVYIHSFTIKEALDRGADIVLCGRVSDPGLSLGPMLHEFKWKKDDYNRLASGTLAGHIIECGAQCTGGNHTRWDTVPDMENIGYPIIEVFEDGKFNVVKNDQTGGIINRFTITEQILYEMGDPKKYISPDVCIDFTSFDLIDNNNNSVSIENVKGYPPTDTYKVSISYLSGYKATSQLTISGPNAFKKAQKTAEIIWKRLQALGYTYNEANTEYLGLTNCQDEYIVSNISEVVLRLSVKDIDRKKVARFGKEIAPVITNGPAGITGFAGGRPKPQEIISYWPTLIPKDIIKCKVDII